MPSSSSLLALLALRVLFVLGAAPPPQHLPAQQQSGIDQVASASSLSDVELETGDEEEEGDEEDSRPGAQHLFPSFSAIFPPLGHSRPSFFPESNRNFQVETFRYTPRNSPSSSGLFSSGGDGGETGADDNSGVLGSGNFGVIRGGTYYSGGGGAAADEAAFLRGNNAHSRPYRRPNPPPLYRGGGDFFQGFRDFADITTPAKGAYSQYVVVYANRRGEPTEVVSAPRNIMEQLELLEAEEKRSKNKKKLDAFKEKEKTTDLKKKTKNSPKQDQLEPLLALS